MQVTKVATVMNRIKFGPSADKKNSNNNDQTSSATQEKASGTGEVTPPPPAAAAATVVVRDAKDDEIDKLRAEMLLLEQNKKANGTGEAVAAVVTTATSVSSTSSKSLQRLAIESLFAPVSHQNTAAMVSLFVEIGLDSNNIESAEAMLSDVDVSYLQRLAAGLKVGPQGLFTKAFLLTNK